MKLLENAKLDSISTKLCTDNGLCRIVGRVESYSCKMADNDKKLYKQLSTQTDTQASATMPGVPSGVQALSPPQTLMGSPVYGSPLLTQSGLPTVLVRTISGCSTVSSQGDAPQFRDTISCKTLFYLKSTSATSVYRVKAYFCAGSLLRVIGLMIVFSIVLPLSMTRCGFNLLMKVKKGSFSVVLTGHGYSADNTEKSKVDASLRVRVQGAEPGYVATSALMVQFAFCLVNERDKLPKEGGMYTPAVAFGNTNIVENLEATGKIKFKVEQP